jgi:hypothetical protein
MTNACTNTWKAPMRASVRLKKIDGVSRGKVTLQKRDQGVAPSMLAAS